MSRPSTGRFIATREHRRFVEFAAAVRRHGYIGVCYGPAGVGKTLSARRYAHWDTAEPYLTEWGPRRERDAAVKAKLNRSRTVLFTAQVTTTVRQLDAELDELIARLHFSIEEHLQTTGALPAPPAFRSRRFPPTYTELLIVDEAERLKAPVLEHLRDRYDRIGIGLILIGMPGIEKRLSRYPQLYSRIGFAHHYRPLDDEELTFVLTRHWKQLGLVLDTSDFTDAQAIAAIARLTGGNFRLLQRLFIQIDRVMKINQEEAITAEVVEAAASTLVLGAT